MGKRNELGSAVRRTRLGRMGRCHVQRGKEHDLLHSCVPLVSVVVVKGLAPLCNIPSGGRMLVLGTIEPVQGCYDLSKIRLQDPGQVSIDRRCLYMMCPLLSKPCLYSCTNS